MHTALGLYTLLSTHYNNKQGPTNTNSILRDSCCFVRPSVCLFVCIQQLGGRLFAFFLLLLFPFLLLLLLLGFLHRQPWLRPPLFFSPFFPFFFLEEALGNSLLSLLPNRELSLCTSTLHTQTPHLSQPIYEQTNKQIQ